MVMPPKPLPNCIGADAAPLAADADCAPETKQLCCAQDVLQKAGRLSLSSVFPSLSLVHQTLWTCRRGVSLPQDATHRQIEGPLIHEEAPFCVHKEEHWQFVAIYTHRTVQKFGG